MPENADTMPATVPGGANVRGMPELIAEGEQLLRELMQVADSPDTRRIVTKLAGILRAIAASGDPIGMEKGLATLRKMVAETQPIGEFMAALKSLPTRPTTADFASLKAIAARISDPAIVGSALDQLGELEVHSKTLRLLQDFRPPRGNGSSSPLPEELLRLLRRRR